MTNLKCKNKKICRFLNFGKHMYVVLFLFLINKLYLFYNKLFSPTEKKIPNQRNFLFRPHRM